MIGSEGTFFFAQNLPIVEDTQTKDNLHYVQEGYFHHSKHFDSVSVANILQISNRNI
jgi:hypothetical protein